MLHALVISQFINGIMDDLGQFSGGFLPIRSNYYKQFGDKVFLFVAPVLSGVFWLLSNWCWCWRCKGLWQKNRRLLASGNSNMSDKKRYCWHLLDLQAFAFLHGRFCDLLMSSFVNDVCSTRCHTYSQFWLVFRCEGSKLSGLLGWIPGLGGTGLKNGLVFFTGARAISTSIGFKK